MRMISSATSTQQLDSRLIAFYTILTVALSLMLSFKQSRCLLINATAQCSLFKVKKCLKCFKGFKVLENKNNKRNNNKISKKNPSRFSRNLNINKNKENNQDCISNNSNNISNNNNTNIISGTGVSNCFSYTKYLKLKRLKTIASIATKFTASTLKLNSYYYLFKKLNFSFTKMRKTTGSAVAQSEEKKTRRIFFRLRSRSNSNNNRSINKSNISSSNDENYCPNCETEETIKEASLKVSYSLPTFTQNQADDNNCSAKNLNRLNSSVKIYNSKVKRVFFGKPNYFLKFLFKSRMFFVNA